MRDQFIDTLTVKNLDYVKNLLIFPMEQMKNIIFSA